MDRILTSVQGHFYIDYDRLTMLPRVLKGCPQVARKLCAQFDVKFSILKNLRAVS